MTCRFILHFATFRARLFHDDDGSRRTGLGNSGNDPPLPEQNRPAIFMSDCATSVLRSMLFFFSIGPDRKYFSPDVRPPIIASESTTLLLPRKIIPARQLSTKNRPQNPSVFIKFEGPQPAFKEISGILLFIVCAIQEQIHAGNGLKIGNLLFYFLGILIGPAIFNGST